LSNVGVDYLSKSTIVDCRQQGVCDSREEDRSDSLKSVPPFRSFAGASQGDRILQLHSRSMTLELVDWTGRSVRSNKCGSIDPRVPMILTRLKFDADVWCHAMRPDCNLERAVDRTESMQLHAQSLRQSWTRRSTIARRLFA
jgi:hypothetical protein